MKHMRLPNGFGQISKIKSKKLRKPYRAMVTVGKTPEGRPIVKTLKPVGYFKTYNEAYTALLEYNKDPYDLDLKTLQDVYDEWLPKYKLKVGPKSISIAETYWQKFEPIQHIPIREIRARHCKSIIDSIDTYSVKLQAHKILNLLLDYAMEYDLVDNNYSRSVKVTRNINEETKSHVVFTKDELETLWKHKDDQIVRAVLIQCYSGWRPSELLDIRTENIHTENWTFVGGMKTTAGRDRLVPIHKKIRDLVTSNGIYMIEPHLTYDAYKKRFIKKIAELGLNSAHKPHDGRKTFVTMCKNAGVDEYAIKYMVGHAIQDITEKVYTERDINFLTTELSKV